jgi:UDP-hydrolysing UDP-N-acetyl-D-glucosamine 2-epimerase
MSSKATPRKVCVVVGSRANYSSIKSAMRAVRDHPDLELQLVVGASALLDRYGTVVDVIERDGFEPAERVFMLIEGETPGTMAKSTGLGLLELPTAFERLQPDVVITVGDRFETMATALAATYMNLPLAHTMGGEVSGNIDESIRHAVTKFAHIHFPSSKEAAERIVRMGEPENTVYTVGCPRMDLVAETLGESRDGLSDLFATGVGGSFDLDKPFLLVSQHPVTTEYGDGEAQIAETLAAVQELGLPAVVLWPNADAGSEDVARGIRKFREFEDDSRLHFFKNLPTNDYIKLMGKTACLIGNSSSAIREGSFIGTPAVNIGPRQEGRDRGSNVVDSGYDCAEIAAAIRSQLEHGAYEREPIYGDGHAGERIADVLAGVEVGSVQKRITY